MRRFFFFVGCLILQMTISAQQSLIRFYTTDGGVRDYNLDDIEQVVFINRTDDMIMEVFMGNAGQFLYPARAISKFGFDTDSVGGQLLAAYIFDQPRHFPIPAIDSIVFSQLEPKVVQNITVVDSLSRGDLLAVEENTVVFRAGSALASGVVNNWYIVSEPVPQAPFGFLRKVTGITTQGNQLIATTEEASIFDIVEEGIIAFQTETSSADPGALLKWDGPVPAGSSPDKSTSMTYTYPMSYTDYWGYIIRGTLNFSVDADFYIIIRGFEPVYLLKKNIGLEYYDFEITTEDRSDAINYEGSLNDLLYFADYYLPYKTVWVGNIPLVVVSYINMPTTFYISPSLRSHARLNLSQVTIIGFEYNAHGFPDKWRHYGTLPWVSYNFPPPGLSSGVVMLHSVGPKLHQYFYEKPYDYFSSMGMYNFLDLTLDFSYQPFWQLSGGMETDASFWFLRFPELNKQFPRSRKADRILAQTENLIGSVWPSIGVIGDTITIFGGEFGDSQGESFVGFKYGETLLPGDVIMAADILLWKNNVIECVVPSDFFLNYVEESIMVDLLVNIRGYWSNIAKFQLNVFPMILSIMPDTVFIGKELVINGKLLGEERYDSSVSFGGIIATEYLKWSDTEIVVKVPEGIEDGMLRVEVDGRVSNQVPYVVAVPIITSIHPEDVLPGAELIIRGKYFGEVKNNSFVSFTGVTATQYSEWSDTKIVLTVPPGIENGQLWVEVSGKISNKVDYVIKAIEVVIMPPRLVIYELQPGVTQVTHDFEAYALPDSVYRFTWNFGDGQTFSEVVQKGNKSKISHTYLNVKGGDVYYPSVELFDLSGKLLAKDAIEIKFTGDNEEPYLGPNSFYLELFCDVYQGVAEDNVQQMLTFKMSGKVTSSEAVKIKKIKPNAFDNCTRELLIIKNRNQKIEIEARLLTYITPVEARSRAESDGSYYLYSYTNPAFGIFHHTTDWFILPEDTFRIEIDLEAYQIGVAAVYDHTVKICDETGDCEIEDSWMSQTGGFAIHVVYDEVGHGFDLEDDD